MLALGLSVANWPTLVVGAGTVGARRVRTLLDAGARVRVIAPEAGTAIVEEAAQGRLEWLVRGAVPSDVTGHRLVAIAISDHALARELAAVCRLRGILVNVADDPAACDFHFPAVVRRGPIQVAVSTDGIAPGVAGWLRQRLEKALEPELGALADHFKAVRNQLRERVPDAATRKSILEALLRDSALLERIRSGQALDIESWVSSLVGQGGFRPR